MRAALNKVRLNPLQLLLKSSLISSCISFAISSIWYLLNFIKLSRFAYHHFPRHLLFNVFFLLIGTNDNPSATQTLQLILSFFLFKRSGTCLDTYMVLFFHLLCAGCLTLLHSHPFVFQILVSLNSRETRTLSIHISVIFHVFNVFNPFPSLIFLHSPTDMLFSWTDCFSFGYSVK